MVLLDTCALLWWTFDPDALSARAKLRIAKEENSGGFAISSISVWEVGVKIKNNKLDIGMPLDKYVNLLERVQNLVIVPVDSRIWVESLSLDWKHKDPADRVIVASAKIEAIPIITKDQQISNFYKNSIW